MDVTALHARGIERQLAGDLVAAERLFQEALKLCPGRPVSEAALGTTLLAQGRYPDGFRRLEARRRLSGENLAPPLPFPLWQGQPVTGRSLLVWSEEGFGDQIMFARFALQLRAEGAKVSWLCPSPLVRLFAREGIDALTADQSHAFSGVDYYCPSSALPAGMAAREWRLSGAPYLTLPRSKHLRGRIGVMAEGAPHHRFDALRSLPSAERDRLLALPGAISLRPEDTGAKDFLATASILAGLDLVISVDTAVAHLAGALGVPTWVLLREPAVEWRWLQGVATSPWYSSARLYRQARAGDWSEVVDRVLRDAVGPG